MQTSTREPAVAGAFYSADRDELRTHVKGLLGQHAGQARSGTRPKALIVPHAGYVYSGAVAASAYRELVAYAEEITRVVLLGPCHRVAIRGLALSHASRFATPMGDIPLDTESAARLASLPFVGYSDEAHAQEHSLEVQLPFLQEVLGPFTLLPLACGQASGEQVAQVLDQVWGGSETLIVVSSDLSHYLDYQSAKELDARSTRAIEELAPERLARESACGLVPLRGLLVAAQKRSLRVHTLDLRNSGDTAGPKEQVVGYGAYSLA